MPRVHAQTDIRGFWLSGTQDYLFIGAINIPSESCELSNEYVRISTYAYRSGDTLNLASRYLNHKFRDVQVNRTFLIIHVNDTFLHLKPLSAEARKCIGKKPFIVFTRSEHIKTRDDTGLVFERLAFQTPSCRGCPFLDLKIDNQKRVIFKGTYFLESASGVDTIVCGSYEGELPDSLYNQLTALLQHCNLRALHEPLPNKKYERDRNSRYLSVHYNNSQKRISYSLPILFSLDAFLESLGNNMAAKCIPTIQIK